MTDTAIAKINETTLTSEATELVTYGNNFIAIKTQDEFAMADEYLKMNKAKQKAIVDYFDPEIEAANKVHKGLCAKKKAALADLQENHKSVTAACQVWLDEQERLRAAEQARLDAIAKQQAEDAQKTILAEAEKEEAAGDLQGAADLIEQAADIVPRAEQAKGVATTYKSPAGTSSWVTDLEITVVNPADVYKAVQSGELPINCIEIAVKTGVLKQHFKGKGITEYNANGLKVREIRTPRARV